MEGRGSARVNRWSHQVMLALESSMPTLSNPLNSGLEAERSPRVPATLSLLLAESYDAVCPNFDQRGKYS